MQQNETKHSSINIQYFHCEGFQTGRLLRLRFALERRCREAAAEMDVSGKRRSTAELSPHQRSAIRTSPRCLEGEERRRRWVCLTGLRRGETFFQPRCKNSPNPRQETRRPDFPRFLRPGRKRTTKMRIREQQTNRNISRLTQGSAWRVWHRECNLIMLIMLMQRGNESTGVFGGAACLCWTITEPLASPNINSSEFITLGSTTKP